MVMTEIHHFEQVGTLPAGAYERAADDIITGDFSRKWSHLFPGQSEEHIVD